MIKRLTVLSCAHAAVDFVCAALMFGRLGGQWASAALVYNFCAFALQMPLGALCDRMRRPARLSALGCLLTALAGLLPSVPAVWVLGVGNALFHVGGGTELLRADDRAAPLGIFVAPGAAGVFFGTQLGRLYPGAVGRSCVLTALCAGVLLLLPGRNEPPRRAAVPQRADGTARAALCLGAVVVLRSYVGLCQDFSWKSAYALPLLAATVGGKALGGVLCDRFGTARTAWGTLLPAAVCFALSGRALPGVAAVLLFNATMPVTLWMLARRMPGEEGFAFGLLTFGLFLGYFPVQAGWGAAMTAPWLAAAALVSLALLLCAERRKT